jgi:RNA polymerase sigma-70 factor (ECF subfamily)
MPEQQHIAVHFRKGRDVLLLRHLEQLSVAEVAQVLQVPEGTIKSRHYRALQRLKSALEDREGEA